VAKPRECLLNPLRALLEVLMGSVCSRVCGAQCFPHALHLAFQHLLDAATRGIEAVQVAQRDCFERCLGERSDPGGGPSTLGSLRGKLVFHELQILTLGSGRKAVFLPRLPIDMTQLVPLMRRSAFGKCPVLVLRFGTTPGKSVVRLACPGECSCLSGRRR